MSCWGYPEASLVDRATDERCFGVPLHDKLRTSDVGGGMADVDPATDEVAPGPRTPQPLDYPSPSLSSFDRPVEPVVRFARGVRLGVRITYVVAAILGLAFVVWEVLQLRAAFEAMGQ